MTAGSVSIIIPHRNQIDRLKACLKRLVELGYGSHEIIVIDNSSSDSLNFLKNFPVQLLYADSLPSPYIARNLGITQAGGEVIVLLDVNALVEPGWLEKALSILHEKSIVAGIPLRPDPESMDIRQRFDYLYAVIDPIDDFPLRALPATNLFFYKSTWERVGPFPLVRSLGDMAWTIRARKMNYELIVNSSIRFTYPFKSGQVFTAKFRRLGGGKAENGFVKYPFWYIVKNFLPPSPRFVHRMHSKNRRENMELSLLQICWLCYVVKINYALGALRYYVRKNNYV